MSTEKTTSARRATARPRATARTRVPRATSAKRDRGTRARGTADASSVSQAPRSASSRRTPADLLGAAARFRAPLIALAVALVVVVVLYGPACAYYQAWRTNGTLQERDAQATSETGELEGDINNLMTEEGIKDEARRRGYVDEGETRIVLEGDETADDQDTAQDEGQTPWYVALGDFIFQYQGA